MLAPYALHLPLTPSLSLFLFSFSSVLYPDITRLVNLDEEDYVPCDVYGQEKKIPPFNMFVAGTSCKNFSMQNSKFRIDIEDKGCSGETFLAATEVLFKEKPELAIFENVDKAPWVSDSSLSLSAPPNSRLQGRVLFLSISFLTFHAVLTFSIG